MASQSQGDSWVVGIVVLQTGNHVWRHHPQQPRSHLAHQRMDLGSSQLFLVMLHMPLGHVGVGYHERKTTRQYDCSFFNVGYVWWGICICFSTVGQVVLPLGILGSVSFAIPCVFGNVRHLSGGNHQSWSLCLRHQYVLSLVC